MEMDTSETPAEKKSVRITTKEEEKKSQGKIKINHLDGLPINEKGYVSHDRWKELSTKKQGKVLEKRKAIQADGSREFSRHPKYADRPDTSKSTSKDKGDKEKILWQEAID